MIQKNKNILNKVSVAPNFFIHYEYFEQLNSFVEKWWKKDIKRIDKKYGAKCIRRIRKGEIPISAEEENKYKNSLIGSALKKREEEENQCFLALVEMDTSVKNQVAFYQSYLIYVYSELESILDHVCNKLRFKKKLELSLKDINGKGISRSNKYLVKVAKLKLPEEKLITELVLIRDIRNCLVHSGGYTSDINLIKRIEKTNYIEVLNEDYSTDKKIFLSKEYCTYAIKIIDRYFLSLVKKNKNDLWHWEVN